MPDKNEWTLSGIVREIKNREKSAELSIRTVYEDGEIRTGTFSVQLFEPELKSLLPIVKEAFVKETPIEVTGIMKQDRDKRGFVRLFVVCKTASLTGGVATAVPERVKPKVINDSTLEGYEIPIEGDSTDEERTTVLNLIQKLIPSITHKRLTMVYFDGKSQSVVKAIRHCHRVDSSDELKSFYQKLLSLKD